MSEEHLERVRDLAHAYEQARQRHMRFQEANVANLSPDQLVELRGDAAVAEAVMMAAYKALRAEMESTP